MAFELKDENNWGRIVHEHALKDLSAGSEVVDTNTYPTALTMDGDTLTMTQTDPTKNLEINLGFNATVAKLKRDILERRYIHNYEYGKISGQAILRGAKQGTYTATRYAGKLVEPALTDENFSRVRQEVLEMFTPGMVTTPLPNGNDKLVFLNTLSSNVFLERADSATTVKKVDDRDSLIAWRPDNARVGYVVTTGDDEGSVTKTILAVVPYQTTLIQYGYNPLFNHGTLAVFMNYLRAVGASEVKAASVPTTKDELATWLADYKLADGSYSIPLSYQLTDNHSITEVEPTTDDKAGFNLPDGYELRKYVITL